MPTSSIIPSIIIAALFSSSFPAFAEVRDDSVKTQEELERVREQLKEKKESARAIAQKEKSAFDELEAAGKALAKAQEEERDIQKRLKTVDAEVSRLSAYLDEQRSTLASRERELNPRMRSLYKLGRDGYFSAIFTADNHPRLLRHYKYLQIIAADDKRLFSEFNSAAQDTEKKRVELERQKSELVSLKEKALQKRAEVSQKVASQKTFLNTVARERAFNENVAKGLEDSSLRLQGILKEATEKRQQQVSVTPVQAPATAVSAPKEGGERQASRMPPSFTETRGRLAWPGNGAVTGRFGRSFDAERKVEINRRGIEIAAPADSEIKAVFPGTVIYANWLKGYGKTVLIEHSGGYYTVYAHCADILVREGDKAEEGQVLGTVGDSGSLNGVSLYFEIRRGGDAEDPVLWLKR